MKDIAILSGSSHPLFAKEVCKKLGIKPALVTLSKFSNQETNVEIHESVRGKDVYIIQSTTNNKEGSVNDHIMEMLIMLAACKTSSARTITAVLPCFPYSRQPDVPYEKLRNQLYRYCTPEINRFSSIDDFELDASSYLSDSTKVTPTSSPSTKHKFEEPATIDGKLNGLTVDLKNLSTPSMKDIPLTPTPGFSSLYEDIDIYSPSGPPQSNTYKHWTAKAGTLIADMLSKAGKHLNNLFRS